MRRAAPRLVLALGVVLCALGIALFWRANRPGSPTDGGWAAYTPLPAETAYQSRLTLSFDDDRWAVLWTAGHVVGAGLVVAGLLVLSGLAGWLLGRRRPAGESGAPRRVPATGAAAVLLVVTGVVLALTGGVEPVVLYEGSYEPLACPDGESCGARSWRRSLSGVQLAGGGVAVLGGLLLAGVVGRSLGGERPVDQG